MAGFGSKFRPMSNAAVQAAATPPSGNSPEAIWHCVYDTQTYTSASTTRLTFFQSTNTDATLSNMEASGQFPNPQSFQIHNICCDIIPAAAGVSTAAGGAAGNLDDMALLLLVARPVFTLTIANKQYGPYPLTVLHGTGGPTGFGWGTFTAEESLQYGKNDSGPGWNYFGSLIIPTQNSFKIDVQFAAAQTLTANPRIRLSMFGVLNRRVL